MSIELMSTTPRPPRSSYYAYTDYPDEEEYDGLELPEWLNFDARDMEL